MHRSKKAVLHVVPKNAVIRVPPLRFKLIPSATGAMLVKRSVSSPMCVGGLRDTTQHCVPMVRTSGGGVESVVLVSLLSHRENASRDGAGRFLLQSARLTPWSYRTRWDLHHAAKLEPEKAASNPALK